MGRLEGKVAIVTGATKGIGRVIAATMAREGARIVIAGRTAKRGEEVVAAIQAEGGDALYVQADIGNEADVEKVVRAAVDRYGKLTTLINNAASTDLINATDGPIAATTAAAWEQSLRVTLIGTMLMSKHAIPRMIEAGGGAIVHTSSEASQRPMPEMAAYAAAKAAVNSLSRSIAAEYGRSNIRSNVILTGMILPPNALAAFLEDPVLGAKVRGQHLTRPGRREDIAAGVVYLASDESGFVTGIELPIEGGSRIMTNLIGKDDIFQNKA
ncbi:MAG: SDR family oxidoreductase [Rhodocyclaceae bacterium]|jgi:NAD(P)-dependent dehydrogenase (short-subunit alcohol dehydrogenase family)|nr:SDR family oxidoreductase [Rhodocyclaceae bacterium]